MKTYAINICLIPSQPVYDVCCELNTLDMSDYNNNSRAFIPHVTLVMKNVSSKALGEITQEIQNIQHEKIKLSHSGYYAREGGGDLRTGLSLEKNNTVQGLQELVIGITRKYDQLETIKSNYAIDGFYSKRANEHIARGTEDEYLLRDGLHLTLGLSNIQEKYEKLYFPDRFTFDTLCIGHMGNYGSVRDILFEKKLL